MSKDRAITKTKMNSRMTKKKKLETNIENKPEINTRQLNKSDSYMEFNQPEIKINLSQQIKTIRDLSKVAKFNKVDFNQPDFMI
jgi:hypothetical protein